VEQIGTPVRQRAARTKATVCGPSDDAHNLMRISRGGPPHAL